MRTKIKIIIFLVVIFFTNQTFAEDKSFVKIIKEGDLISAEIKNANIVDVFKQISEKFNIEYRVFPEMQNKFITVSFLNTSLLEGIKNILQTNYLLKLNNKGEIIKVFILNRGEEDFSQRNELLKSFLNEKILAIDALKDVVTKNVKKEYPLAQLFITIPHKDIKGNLKSYVFSYYIGSDDMPSLDKVKADINNAWAFKKAARTNIIKAYQEQDSSTMIEWLEKLKPYDYKLRQTQDFISLEISADYNSPPVKKFYKGLPYDLAMYPNAIELLERKIKDMDGIEFHRTFIIDLLAIGFEFRDTKNNIFYYVDVLNNAVFDGWKDKPRTNRNIIHDPQRVNDIKKQWEEFLFF